MEAVLDKEEDIKAEINVFENHSHHPNIVSFFGAFVKKDTIADDQLWIVMEVTQSVQQTLLYAVYSLYSFCNSVPRLLNTCQSYIHTCTHIVSHHNTFTFISHTHSTSSLPHSPHPPRPHCLTPHILHILTASLPTPSPPPHPHCLAPHTLTTSTSSLPPPHTLTTSTSSLPRSPHPHHLHILTASLPTPSPSTHHLSSFTHTVLLRWLSDRPGQRNEGERRKTL